MKNYYKPLLRSIMWLSFLTPLGSVAFITAASNFFATSAHALTCGTTDGTICKGAAFQYGGSFNPQVGEFGGFGGAANCTVTRTPVIFVHGNADNSTSWDVASFQVPGYAKAPNSVYREFKAAGYQDCELFGVTYHSASEQGKAANNYHSSIQYAIIQKFIDKVKTYTGKSQVDVVGHSMGVSMSMATLTYYGSWGSVRRFVNIAGGLHGVDSCLWVGYANALVTTCGSQNGFDSNMFGFYPNAAAPGINSWTGTSANKALANSAAQHSATAFYTIYAGTHDELMCATTSDVANCWKSPLLNTSAGNVKAQLNIGAGSNTKQLNWDWSTGSPYNVQGGDSDGVGHFHAKNNAGKIILKMLNSSCLGTGCAVDYAYGPVN